MQLAHPRHMDIYVQNSKHKSQNTEVTTFEKRTQNICIQNKMPQIGFRKHAFCITYGNIPIINENICLIKLSTILLKCFRLEITLLSYLVFQVLLNSLQRHSLYRKNPQ